MNQHTNRLVHESSPYLLQHAHNPVDWYPWGEEALTKAKEQDKPILVSIGYSACHWCHVMERESFENEDTAKLMNELFINIKIDREERPDIDHIYMDAVQAMTGSGGWPLNVFLLPDGKPFYGGTYFPPVKAFNRSSWNEVLTSVGNAYKTRKDELELQAQNLTQHIKQANIFGAAGINKDEDLFSVNSLENITANLLKNSDKKWGGFGNAPKFPQTFSIQFLLRDYYFTKNEESLNQALLSLDKMIYGGIYDHLAGGFARYSTDEKWLAPHFEKMLYDNALLLIVLAEAYQLTGVELYKATIEKTMEFIQKEMMSAEGGFYSALDADSEGVEGRFYTWDYSDIADILKEDAILFCEFYNVVKDGNWEHTNILWITKSFTAFAAEKGMNEDEFEEILKECRSKLLADRSKRIRPTLDDKILIGWNALMNIACCKVYAATGIDRYKEMGENNMTFIEKAFTKNGDKMWLHTYKNGTAKYPAFLDDYACLISAYIHLQEITTNCNYLLKAKKLTELVIENFLEEETGYFFYTEKNQVDVIIRKKEVYDGATPSGNAVMAINLHYLSTIFYEQKWNEHARKMVSSLGNAIVNYPTSFGNWACLMQQITYGSAEIIITGQNTTDLTAEVLKMYIPGKIFQVSNKEKNGFPLLENKQYLESALIYLCINFSCKTPVTTVADLKTLLK